MKINKFILGFVCILQAMALYGAEQFVMFSGNKGLHLNSGAVAVYVSPDAPSGVQLAAKNLCTDISTVCGTRAFVTNKKSKAQIIISTTPNGKWEEFVIQAGKKRLEITGSDQRGTIYGIYELSRQIGVSPWYWWADVPVARHNDIYIKEGTYTDGEPAVKYRGIFINDEDWGLKPWASNNFEKELGDIGPKTYAKVCELILRLKGNMLAPAMHSCTGAFYSHPESKFVADSMGVIITTSHCEPLLLNNAADTEWNKARDGEWNYATNKATIQKKWNDRLAEAAHLDNIYTMAMRGVHDEGLRGNLSMKERVGLLNEVIADQREMLVKHKGMDIESIPQIFVPYKETMDVYENGLQVPEDITIVWVDDNYGYMKRVSCPEEQKRKGGTGVYYHLSYLGTPHDYLWLNTTPPVLMYEELTKAYRTGANRYWLLNVGDIKPMELGISTFFDLAWCTDDFDIESVNNHQAEYINSLFNLSNCSAKTDIGYILNEYYRLAWTRKPEYMGGEWEWDDPAHTPLQDTQFSFYKGDAQQRLQDYQRISDMTDSIMQTLPEAHRPAFFEMLAYPVKAAYQMNRKFLMAQLNRNMAAEGKTSVASWAARQSQAANDSINTLTRQYNTMLNGKWNGMMSIPPGFCALYHKMPDLLCTDIPAESDFNINSVSIEPKDTEISIDLTNYNYKSNSINLVRGIGEHWCSVQLDDPLSSSMEAGKIEYPMPITGECDAVTVNVSTIPFFPLYKGKDNRIGVSVDNSEMQIISNHVTEWSREWKEQVILNSACRTLTFRLNPSVRNHVLTFTTIDPGQIIQGVSVMPK